MRLGRFYFLSFGSGCACSGQLEGVAAAVLGDGAYRREREVIPRNRDLVGNRPVEERAARGLGQRRVLVERRMPPRVLHEERGNIGRVDEHNGLILTRTQME